MATNVFNYLLPFATTRIGCGYRGLLRDNFDIFSCMRDNNVFVKIVCKAQHKMLLQKIRAQPASLCFFFLATYVEFDIH